MQISRNLVKMGQKVIIIGFGENLGYRLRP